MPDLTVNGWHDHAKEMRKLRDDNKAKWPQAVASTPSMDRLIAWAERHEERVAKHGDKAAHKQSHAELKDLGLEVHE
jgi:hypothetical protein